MTRIVVIGGGIAGLSAAAALSRDAEVTLLEAEDALGYHSSGRSAALIEQNYGAASVQVLNRASFGPLQEGGYLSPRGLLIVGRAHEKAAFAADMDTLGTVRITLDEARAFVPVLDPSVVTDAGYHAEAFDIDTDRLLQDFARQVRLQGGTLVTGAQVTGLCRAAGHWQVTSGEKTYSADILINAAGAWADGIAKMAGVRPLGIVPHRRSMARIPAPDAHEVSTWPMFFGVGETWYAKPDAGALLVSPADEDPTEPHDAWADDMTLAEGLARYSEVVTTQVTRMLANWAGLRSFAPDRTLVLGPDPDCPTFVWCAGQGGYGIQTSFAAARLVTDLVLGRTSDLPPETVTALKPDRLRP